MAKIDLTKGAYLGGTRSHSKGGIPITVKDTDSQIEAESGEIIVNRKSVNSNTLHDFDGKKLTNKQILSAINTENGNGVPIYKDGGEIDSLSVQSLIFDKEAFTVGTAKKWLKKNGYKGLKVDVKVNTLRFRQGNPKDFTDFKIVDFGENIKAVMGKRKFEDGGEIIKGGVADKKTVQDIANKHGVDDTYIMEQLIKGEKVEQVNYFTSNKSEMFNHYGIPRKIYQYLNNEKELLKELIEDADYKNKSITIEVPFEKIPFYQEYGFKIKE